MTTKIPRPNEFCSVHVAAMNLLTDDWQRLGSLNKADSLDGKLSTALFDLKVWGYAEEKREVLDKGRGEYIYYRLSQD